MSEPISIADWGVFLKCATRLIRERWPWMTVDVDDDPICGVLMLTVTAKHAEGLVTLVQASTPGILRPASIVCDEPQEPLTPRAARVRACDTIAVCDALDFALESAPTITVAAPGFPQPASRIADLTDGSHA